MGEGRVKVLHVVATLDRAGTETWLMHVLRNIDRKRYQMDFLVHWEREFHYEAEVRELGARVIRCLHPRAPWVYARNFRRVLREYGPYDVVHSHVHHFSGIVVKLAAQGGVPVRIVHSHQDSRVVDAQESWARKAYRERTLRWIRESTTLGLAVSESAQRSLFGDQCHRFPIKTIPCSIDLAPFREDTNFAATRNQLNIPADAIVFGHVGRFVAQKNHDFLVQVASEISKLDPRAWLLLIGDGPLRSRIERKSHEFGLAERTTFTGVSRNVRQLMGAMQAFIFPSLHEGLGLALIEAQAAGVPCIYSDVVPKEADVVTDLITRLSLAAPPSFWARIALDQARRQRRLCRTRALELIENSQFGPMKSIQQLQELYRETAGVRIQDDSGKWLMTPARSRS